MARSMAELARRTCRTEARARSSARRTEQHRDPLSACFPGRSQMRSSQGRSHCSAASVASLLSSNRKPKTVEPDPVDEIPAFQRVAATAGLREPIPAPAREYLGTHRRRIRASVPVAPARPPARSCSHQPPQRRRQQQSWSRCGLRDLLLKQLRLHRPVPVHSTEIAIHERADADERTVTVAPKNVSGFKLPPSTLLNSGSGPQVVREDELREEAKVLVEKCAEFDVTRPGGADQSRPNGHDLRIQA